MTDVMLDIETTSTRVHAGILTIGAIRFDRNASLKNLSEYDKFYVKIDIDSCVNRDCHIDESTMSWWESQKKHIKDEAFSGTVPIDEALISFKKWFGRSRFVWGNGDDFDCAILDEWFKKCDITPPWKFWNTRDCRTLYDVTGINLNDFKGREQHNALHDCYYQIRALCAAFDVLKCE